MHKYVFNLKLPDLIWHLKEVKRGAPTSTLPILRFESGRKWLKSGGQLALFYGKWYDRPFPEIESIGISVWGFCRLFGNGQLKMLFCWSYPVVLA